MGTLALDCKPHSDLSNLPLFVFSRGYSVGRILGSMVSLRYTFLDPIWQVDIKHRANQNGKSFEENWDRSVINFLIPSTQ